MEHWSIRSYLVPVQAHRMGSLVEGSAVMIFVGDDWSEAHHDVHVSDGEGRRLASRRFPEGLEGVGGFHSLMAGFVTGSR